MWTTIINKLLDKAVTQDFWRGLLYVIAGLGIVIPNEYATAIVSGALIISGLLHTIWHKTHPAP